jgi:hypothetical protein
MRRGRWRRRPLDLRPWLRQARQDHQGRLHCRGLRLHPVDHGARRPRDLPGSAIATRPVGSAASFSRKVDAEQRLIAIEDLEAPRRLRRPQGGQDDVRRVGGALLTKTTWLKPSTRH